MESGLLLDVVIRQGAAIFELLAGEDQALLVRRNTFLVLDLLLDVVDGIAGLDLESDGLACQGLDEDLHNVFVLSCLFEFEVKMQLRNKSMINRKRARISTDHNR